MLDIQTLAARASRVGELAAGPASADVDRNSRFPDEAFAALRNERLLGVLIPRELGGESAAIAPLADAVTALGRHCASTALIFAMHHIQVACIVRHGNSSFFSDYMREIADKQSLFASATTEIGIGGDVRSSTCAVNVIDGRFSLEKVAPVISFGAHADAVLATARRTPDSPPNDQVLVLCRPPGLSLEPISEWDTLGFRGTCSPGFKLRCEDDGACVLPAAFGDISAQTMLPVSHILWSAAWLGIATAAVDNARRFVQAEARKQPGVTPTSALRLAELTVVFQQMQESVHGAARRFDDIADDPEALTGMGFAIAMNALKVSSSSLVVDIVGRALQICGIAGYREDSPFAMGRLLRDAHGAALMINNDRINANNAQMLLVHRGE